MSLAVYVLPVCLQVFYRERASMMYDPLALGIGEAPDKRHLGVALLCV
jgi:hypothetical protein